MNILIVTLAVIFGLVFEDSQKTYREFPVYPGSVLTGSSEFIANGSEATVSVFESKDDSSKIRNYIIINQTKNGWQLSSSQTSSLSFIKGNKNIKVQIVRNRNNGTTKIVFYKGKIGRLNDPDIKSEKTGEDFSDISRYPGSKRILFIKRLTGVPHSTTIAYETSNSRDSVISFYQNNMNKWKLAKFDNQGDNKLLYFNSEKSWCIITAKQNKDKTVLIIVRYEK